MELKEYQISTLDAFTRWRDALAAAQVQSETAVAALQSVGAVFRMMSATIPKLPGNDWLKMAVWLKLPGNTSAAPTTLAGISRTFALKCQPAAAKRYWLRLPWKGWAGRPA